MGLAARAGRGGYGDHREHRFARLADTPVVLHAAAIGEQEVDPLGAVHHTAPAQADQKVDALGLGDGETGVHMLGRGVDLDPVEQDRVEAGLDQHRPAPLGVTGRDDARVGDEQHAPPPEFACQFAEPV